MEHIELLSDGPVEHLKRGWALMPFIGSRAHFWIEDTETIIPQIRDGGRVRYYTALCGAVALTDNKVPALGVGNWPKCMRCRKKHNVQGQQDAAFGGSA